MNNDKQKELVRCNDCVFAVVESEKQVMATCWKINDYVDLHYKRQCRHFSLSPLTLIRDNTKKVEV